ncbi:hypothetical protein ACJZ2D_016756 [Fusarium nematophilum]
MSSPASSGIPITIATTAKGRGPPFPVNLLRFGGGAIAVWQNLDASQGTLSDGALRLLAKGLRHEIRARCPHVRLVEVIFSTEIFFYIVLGDETDVTAARALPGRIANCPAGYMLERELNRPARQDVLPQVGGGVFTGLLRGRLDLPSKVVFDSPSRGTIEGMAVMKSVKVEGNCLTYTIRYVRPQSRWHKAYTNPD